MHLYVHQITHRYYTVPEPLSFLVAIASYFYHVRVDYATGGEIFS